MKNKFARQLGFLGVIGIVIKIIGAVYRIPLAQFMSETAVTYYSIAYPWFQVLIVISTAALPAVIAKLTAEAGANDQYSDQQLIFGLSKKLMQLFGAGTFTFLLLGANIISKSAGYPESIYSFYVLAIASYFVSLNAVYRGYFQGVQQLEIFGLSQLYEQIGRVVFGLSLVAIVSSISSSDGYIAAAGTSGAAFGAVLSWAYSSKKYRQVNKPIKVKLSENKPMVKKIIKMIIPIAMGASIVPLLSIIDSTMIVWRLRQIGFGDHSGVMFTYIQFYSAPIINLAQVVFTALQVSLLPMITRAFTKKSAQLNEKVYFGVILAIALGFPMGIGISAYAEEILMLLYPSKEAIVGEASQVLSILGLSVPFLSVYQATTGILQGLNQYKKPVRNLLIGAVAKVVTGYILLGIVSVNIKGAAISTLAAYTIAGVLNLIVIFRTVKCPKKFIGKSIGIIASNIAMIAASKYVFSIASVHFGDTISLFIGILTAVVVYAALIFGTKLVSFNDMKVLEESEDV